MFRFIRKLRYIENGTMAVLHHSLRRMTTASRCHTSWTKHHRTFTAQQHHRLLTTYSFNVDQNKIADEKLKTLSPQLREKFEYLKLTHTQLIAEFGEEHIKPQPTPEEWLCALEHIDPWDEIGLIEFFTFLTDQRIAHEEAMEEKRMDSLYETLTENENKIMLMHDSMITRFCHNNMAYAMMNGPHVVLDMSFTPILASKHPRVFSKSIEDCLKVSKSYRQNFHIHFCGVHEDRKDVDINVVGIDWTPVTISYDSYLNHYPREKLVYLTSDAHQPLEKFSFDDVYVIGGLAHFVKHRITLDKAKEEGIRTARFPLELVKMDPHTDLAVPDVLQVLLKLVASENNWEAALSHVIPPPT